MFNAYPYTDFHELNADWIIKELKRIEEALESLYERAVHDAVEQANEYTDGQMEGLREDFEQLRRDFEEVESRMDTVEGDFSMLAARVDNMFPYIAAQINAVNARTDAAIEANNQAILNNLEQFLGNVKVINFFTGERVSIQDMFDYLSMLHVSDGITYTEMVIRNKTYTYLAGLNIDYTDLVMHGNTLYV